jgi:hypothetical protein
MVEYAGSHLSVSNAFTAKSPAAIEADVSTDRDLRYMSIDCGAIFLRLLKVIAPNADLQNADVNAAVYAPWRYKPPQRASGKKQRRRWKPHTDPPMTLRAAIGSIGRNSSRTSFRKSREDMLMTVELTLAGMPYVEHRGDTNR